MSVAVVAEEEVALEEDEAEKDDLEEGLDDDVSEHGAGDDALVAGIGLSEEEGVRWGLGC